MSALHPTDRDLEEVAAGRLGNDDPVMLHVGGCRWCTHRVGSIASHGGVEVGGGATTDGVIGLPIALIADVVGEPVVGDVWRLRWDEHVVLAVVGEIRSHDLDAYALVELGEPTMGTLRIGHEQTGLGVLDVATRHVVAVSRAVLDARLATTNVASDIETVVNSSRAEWEYEPEELLEAVDALEELGAIEWAPLPDVSDELVGSAEDRFERFLDAGLPPNRALAIASRSATPSEEEADLIEQVTGRRPSPVQVDPALRVAIDRPRRKNAILRRARAASMSEGDIRLELARAAEPALVAARGTRGAVPDYDVVIDQLLEDDA